MDQELIETRIMDGKGKSQQKSYNYGSTWSVYFYICLDIFAL